MVTFLKLNEHGDSASVMINDKMFLIIKLNDVGISVDYYSLAKLKDPAEPFKSDQIWFDDLEEEE